MKSIVIVILSLFSFDCVAQALNQDTTQVRIPGFEQYKNDRNAGKILQVLGGLGLTSYFIMSKRYENTVRDGITNATRPPLMLPMVASGVMTLGFVIDMGAVNHLFKTKAKKPMRVSTDDYQF